ncbi:MAG: DUF502 domain-containing protein [Planctomycetes bacterium]|nr:DUF502 domain-containing protein [Planctomycetota bacterium]
MAKKAKEGFVSDFRRFFVRGLATLLPTVLTIFVLVKCFEFIQQNISVHITSGAVWVVVKATNDYPHIPIEGITLTDEQAVEYSRELGLSKEEIDSSESQEAMRLARHEDMRFDALHSEWTRLPRSLVGFGAAIILVYIIGHLLASFFGRRLWSIFERSVGRIPGFRQVYPYVKKVTEFIFGENKIEISRVVAIEYPRKGLWSIGFVTGTGFKKLGEALSEEFMTVFVPSSPMPFTGYVITVKKGEAIDLPIAVEEALRFTVSGGVLVPDHQSVPGERIELSPGPKIQMSPVEGSEKGEG